MTGTTMVEQWPTAVQAEAEGRLEDAAKCYQEALGADGENPELLYRLGRIMGKLGQDDLELALIGQAIARSPDQPDYHADLGHALLAAGYPGEARESYDEALRCDPDHPEALGGLADQLLDAGDAQGARRILGRGKGLGRRERRVRGRLASLDGRWAEASEHLLAHLTDDPLDASGLFFLGVALQSGGLLEPAVLAYRQAVKANPGFFEAHANLATVLTALGQSDEALQHADEAVRIRPDRAGALLNRANARRDAGDVIGARADLTQAVTLSPDYAEAWSTLANLHHDLGQMREALAAHERATTLAPALPQVRWNRSFTLLANGQLAAGWDEYEWRRHTAAAAPEPRDFIWPLWQGERLQGRRLLVWREQGVGDELLFLTCLGDLVAAGADVTLLASPRLVSLLARSFPTVTVLPDDGVAHPDGTFDYQIGLASLPRHLRRDRGAFPDTGAFLVPDPGRQAAWAQRLAALGEGPKIGVSWRSGLMTAERRRHYPGHEALRSLVAGLPSARWVNLQYDDCDGELGELEVAAGVRIHRWPDLDLRNDFEGVAALMSALDHVVSAPTAVSSLAGALGRPTLQMDSGSDWTTLGEGRSPWFPTIRVIARTPEDRTWDRVIAGVLGALSR